jgi:omega-6 fatty acid desaturase (delta-12 desaturase)
MREGRELVRQTRRFAVEHRARSWWSLASTLFVFGGALALAAADVHWLLRLAGSVLAALVNIRVFVLYHDYLHGAILNRSRFAAPLFQAYGLLMLAPPSMWRETHDHHHGNNSRRFGLDTIGSYPILTAEEYRLAWPRARLFYAFARSPLSIAFGYVTVFLYGFCIRPLLLDPRSHKDALAALGLHFGLLALLAVLSPGALFFAFLLPLFLAYAFGSYLFYAQHNFPAAKLRTGDDWDYVAAALHSSSFMPMNRVLSWFTGNIGYHHVHHLNSKIPFYRLPEAMAAIKGLQTPGKTTLWPRDIICCLRLKLWDPEEDRLVSFAEARRKARRAGALKASLNGCGA